MPALIFEDDSILQFGERTLGYRWGNAPGVVANRVALEACVQACNERDVILLVRVMKLSMKLANGALN